MYTKSKHIAVIGAGAAGVFAAVHCKELNPDAHVVLYEKTRQPLAKVRISGGGRCNVTHACFDPKQLVTYYPRGSKELLGPFHRFQPRDTVEWFAKRGVILKTEADGRMFPITDSSQTIIDCLMGEVKRLGVELHLGTKIETLPEAEAIILASGSAGYELAKEAGHTIVEPVPSLFTFNVPTSPLLDLAGISVPHVRVRLFKHVAEGPLLLTHWGFSGPAILRLSAFAARELHACNYQATLTIEWGTEPLARNLRSRLTPEQLVKDHYAIDGKTTYKQEFVTAGGIELKEVNFQTMESKKRPGLYFAGEILNIDGVTGGFNFQNAWTTAYLAAAAAAAPSPSLSRP